MKELKVWLNPYMPERDRIASADGHITRLEADLAALRAENDRLKADKRELVEAIASMLNMAHYEDRKAIIDAAVAKHKDK